LTPDRFIPQLGQQGRMDELDNRMLCEAICLFETLAARSVHPLPLLSVNVSPQVLADCSYLHHVLQAAAAVPGIRNLLQLEITEEQMMERSMIPALESLREAGIKIALDDMGAGCSSVSYLSRYPCDTVKLDRSLVQQVPENARACVVLKSMLAMCHDLGLDVVVEGVERGVQRDWLKANGCKFAQGFLWTEPMRRQRWVHLLTMRSELRQSFTRR